MRDRKRRASPVLPGEKRSVSRHSAGNITTHLDESDGSRLLTETLTAEVDTVLADETSLVGAEAAVDEEIPSVLPYQTTTTQ